MKLLSTLLVVVLAFPPAETNPPLALLPVAPAQNLFIVTLDGFRWQEVFAGADPALLSNPKYTPDTALAHMMYGDADAQQRRARLLPFFWHVVAKKGSLYGNRNFGNKVNVANLYHFSYPGYNEMLTGKADFKTSSNEKRNNHNITLLEFLQQLPQFAGQVAAFSSWDVFPYILNEARSGIYVNSGYQQVKQLTSQATDMLNAVQAAGIDAPGNVRYDGLTFIAAKEYVAKKQPRVLFLSFGETDEAAHAGRYDLYLQAAKETDAALAQLWQYIQTTPAYRNKTTLLITTDHGRGRSEKNWTTHGMFIAGSSQTWIAALGPNIPALGEVQVSQQLYQKDVAATAAQILGVQFGKQ